MASAVWQQLVAAFAVWQQLVGASYWQRLVVVADLKQLWISIALRSLYSSRLCSTSTHPLQVLCSPPLPALALAMGP